MQYTLKKSLGQHFLKDENICRKIADAVTAYPFKNLLEVGPGAGALTKYFIEIKDIHFKAVELDLEKIQYLVHHYPIIKDKIIHKSFLDMEMPFEEDFSIAGNFPYNISSQIVFKILEWKDFVPNVTGMFQKEVAQRIAAVPGNKSYGILSVLAQAFYRVEYLFDVSEQCFNPPPKVKSGVIRLARKNETPGYKSERLFFNLVKTAFNQRRKMLRNSVKSLFDEKTLSDEAFTKRPEQLSVNEFMELTHLMK